MNLLRLSPIIKSYLSANWIGFSIVSSLLFLVFICGYINYKNKKRVEIDIQTNKKINNEKSFKIIGISDLHLGYGISKAEFSDWINLINAENPDFVLIAGDAIDNSTKPIFEQNYAELFHRINTKYGIYAVIGNHEYISGLNKCKKFYEDANINLLIDSVININDDITIIGRDDKTNKNRKTLSELCKAIDTSKFTILLDHQPLKLNETAKNNIDFQFSGHTHDGQLIPINWITYLMYENSHGLLKKGDSQIYVSSGIGIWGGKFRIGTNSEYIVINITSNK
ncbi:MAG: metallophosphoesterase [Bacteroidales bacterium]|jgi:predicted MPP superfamily phosphohydrolase|nr:metallophosphoesterase [Bacteroidales bacterium]